MNIKELPRMIDLSCVKTESTQKERELMVKLARDYKFICCFAMPQFTPWLVEATKDLPDTVVGAAIGFPSGSDLTEIKVQTAKMQLEMGCEEFDMVLNVSALIDGNYDLVAKDIKAVREAVPGKLLKVILEVCYLTDEQIVKGAQIAADCGADFVKTGTGWGPKPTTVEHVKLLKEAVGDRCKIKVAGGVRDLKTLLEMVDAGAVRFGIGLRSVISILKEAGIYSE